MVFRLDQFPSIANQFMAELRSTEIQTDKMRFRRNLERMGEILSYEVSKHLPHHEIEVETPLGISSIHVPKESLVICSILRAGIPLHYGILNFFDHADNAFVAAYRAHHKDGSFEISLNYLTCPELDGKVLLMADSMLATGSSVEKALEAMAEFGTPAHTFLISVIASSDAIERMQRLYPHVHIFVGAVDDELTAKSYIVPGLGDAGDLAFGKKMQE